jgi:hypothetical protein
MVAGLGHRRRWRRRRRRCVGVLKWDRGGKKKRSAGGFEAEAYSSVNRWICLGCATWALNAKPCYIYSSVTDEYTRQIRQLTDEYMWQGHVSPAHDMFIGWAGETDEYILKPSVSRTDEYKSTDEETVFSCSACSTTGYNFFNSYGFNCPS